LREPCRGGSYGSCRWRYGVRVKRRSAIDTKYSNTDLHRTRAVQSCCLEASERPTSRSAPATKQASKACRVTTGRQSEEMRSMSLPGLAQSSSKQVKASRKEEKGDERFIPPQPSRVWIERCNAEGGPIKATPLGDGLIRRMCRLHEHDTAGAGSDYWCTAQTYRFFSPQAVRSQSWGHHASRSRIKLRGRRRCWYTS